MASIPVNTPLRPSSCFSLVLVCATALPAWSDQWMVAGAENRPDWMARSTVAQGSPAGRPPVPTWSAVPLGPEASPGWEWLPAGPGRAPGWAPPAPPVINKAPLWKGL